MIVLATGNKDKVREFQEMIDEEIITMKEAGFSGDIVEDGKNFEENALIKARTVWNFLNEKGEKGIMVFADDSGLSVDALNGEPGIYSARYMGEDTSYRIKMQSIIDRLDKIEKEKGITVYDEKAREMRRARFTCALACILPDGTEHVEIRHQEGIVGKEIRGSNGFGFDAAFYGDDFDGLSNEEVSEEAKNEVSHRGRAIKAMEEWLKNRK